jgi:predicted transcriptional regulator of viral defense system
VRRLLSHHVTHASRFLRHDRLVSIAGHLTGTYGPLDAQHAPAALASRQNGVFSLAQLEDLGLSASAVRKRAATGRLHRVHRGVYALTPAELLTRDGRFMAAILTCGPGAVLSHRSAAALHGLRATDRAGIDVTIPGRTKRKCAGIDVHRSTTLTAADTTTVNGIPCTTIPRSLLDLTTVVPTRGAERAFEQAEAQEVLDIPALQDQLQRNRHRNAMPRVRDLLAKYRPGAAPTESELEEGFLSLVCAAGCPAPERQVYIAPDDGEPAIRVDFVWRAERLALETDGRKYHRTRRAFETDRRRDQRLTLAGWRVVRVTWRQVTDDPATIARLIAGLLAQT